VSLAVLFGFYLSFIALVYFVYFYEQINDDDDDDYNLLIERMTKVQSQCL